MYIGGMWQTLLDALFPRTSLGGQAGTWVTPAELAAMQSVPVVLERAVLRDRGIVSLDRIVAAGQYDNGPLLQSAILTLKYRRIRTLATPLGTLLVRAAPLLSLPSSTVLCPVPLHWTRQFSRGFNQSALLAAIVSEANGWQVHEMLRRVRPTGHQAHRSRAARMTAMCDAFATMQFLNSVPSTVVLIDDVCTTGATLDACAIALKQAGVQRVEALVVALG